MAFGERIGGEGNHAPLDPAGIVPIALEANVIRALIDEETQKDGESLETVNEEMNDTISLVQKKLNKLTRAFLKWCAREDLNLQSFRNQILSLARLPFRHARNRYQVAPDAGESQAFVMVRPGRGGDQPLQTGGFHSRQLRKVKSLFRFRPCHSGPGGLAASAFSGSPWR